MLRRILTAAAAVLLLSGCAVPAAQSRDRVYEATFLTLFDTVTTIKGTAESQEAFEETAGQIRDKLEYYHQLFDIYHDYPGMNNLKTVNDQAGIAPVAVDEALIALLLDCKDYYDLTGGMVNVAMGGVLQLWHEARNDALGDPANARLPDGAKLETAARHMDIRRVEIDEEAGTVYLSDPEMRLDVGAVAKGWSVQRVAETLPEGILLSVGGNICATGPKYSDTPWVIGVRNPAGGAEDYLHTLYVSGGSVVTSGDYQRAYTVDGKLYHHIIDPETRMPSDYWRSVSVICDDSALADALSTALFLLPLEQGEALAEACGVAVLWVNADGEEFMTDRFQERIRT